MITMAVAFGTSTPTSTTVVVTSTSIDPSANDRITRSFSSAASRPCRTADPQAGQRALLQRGRQVQDGDRRPGVGLLGGRRLAGPAAVRLEQRASSNSAAVLGQAVVPDRPSSSNCPPAPESPSSSKRPPAPAGPPVTGRRAPDPPAPFRPSPSRPPGRRPSARRSAGRPRTPGGRWPPPRRPAPTPGPGTWASPRPAPHGWRSASGRPGSSVSSEMSRSPKTVMATVRGIGVAVITSTCGRPSPAFSRSASRCSTPNLCCSSITTRPRSANRTCSSSSACVPIRIPAVAGGRLQQRPAPGRGGLRAGEQRDPGGLASPRRAGRPSPAGRAGRLMPR